jgi:hypothetical protein
MTGERLNTHLGGTGVLHPVRCHQRVSIPLVISAIPQPAVGAAPSPRRRVFQMASGCPRQARYSAAADMFEHCDLLRRGRGAAPTGGTALAEARR